MSCALAILAAMPRLGVLGRFGRSATVARYAHEEQDVSIRNTSPTRSRERRVRLASEVDAMASADQDFGEDGEGAMSNRGQLRASLVDWAQCVSNFPSRVSTDALHDLSLLKCSSQTVRSGH